MQFSKIQRKYKCRFEGFDTYTVEDDNTKFEESFIDSNEKHDWMNSFENIGEFVGYVLIMINLIPIVIVIIILILKKNKIIQRLILQWTINQVKKIIVYILQKDLNQEVT